MTHFYTLMTFIEQKYIHILNNKRDADFTQAYLTFNRNQTYYRTYVEDLSNKSRCDISLYVIFNSDKRRRYLMNWVITYNDTNCDGNIPTFTENDLTFISYMNDKLLL